MFMTMRVPAMQLIKLGHTLHDVSPDFQVVILDRRLPLFIQEFQAINCHVFAKLLLDVLTVLLAHLNPVILHVHNLVDIVHVHQMPYLLFVH